MPKGLNLTLFDVVTIIVVLVGIFRGRKRGMSHELLDMIEWVMIVVAAGLAYRPIGQLLMTYANLPGTIANLLGYVMGTVVALLISRAIKRAVGEKLANGDIFGRLEFYLGMIGGAVRFSCMLLFVLALLHAKYSTAEQRAAHAKVQQETMGTITLPTLDGIQQSVFYQSASGQFIRTNLAVLMIQPVPPGARRQTESIGSKKERTLNEVIGK